MGKRISFQQAMDLTPDDLPDGTFFAMAHEIAGLEYGEGFSELPNEPALSRKQRADRIIDRGEAISRKSTNAAGQEHKPFVCDTCCRRFRLNSAARQHWRDTHLVKEGRANG